MSVRNVESIELWSNNPFTKVKLTEVEMKTFVELYNQSQYHSDGAGVGGTPEFGATVYYKNGSVFLVNEFNANYADVEVSFYSATGEEAWCYVNNPELLVYVSQSLNGNNPDN